MYWYILIYRWFYIYCPLVSVPIFFSQYIRQCYHKLLFLTMVPSFTLWPESAPISQILTFPRTYCPRKAVTAFREKAQASWVPASLTIPLPWDYGEEDGLPEFRPPHSHPLHTNGIVVNHSALQWLNRAKVTPSCLGWSSLWFLPFWFFTLKKNPVLKTQGRNGPAICMFLNPVKLLAGFCMQIPAKV